MCASMQSENLHAQVIDSTTASIDFMEETRSTVPTTTSASSLASCVAPSSTTQRSLTLSTAPAYVAFDKHEVVLRHGSPLTRGPHSISPMAPDAIRAPPLELRGPPRYLRARGLTPASTKPRVKRDPKAAGQEQLHHDSLCRRSPSDERDEGNHRSSDKDAHDGVRRFPSPGSSSPSRRDDGDRCMTLSTSPTPLLLPGDTNDKGPQSPATCSMVVEPHRVGSLQPSSVPCSALSMDEHSDLGNRPPINLPQQLSAAQPPPSPSISRCSLRDFSLQPQGNTTSSVKESPSRRGAGEDMVLAVPRLSCTQAATSNGFCSRTLHPPSTPSPCTSSTQHQRLGQRYGESCDGVPLGLFPWQRHHHGQRSPPRANAPDDVKRTATRTRASGALLSEMAPSATHLPANPLTTQRVSSTSPIWRSCCSKTFSSNLPLESTELLGAHNDVGPTTHWGSHPWFLSPATGDRAAVTCVPSGTIIAVEVVFVAAVAASHLDQALLVLYENTRRRWFHGQGKGGAEDVARYDGHYDAPHPTRTRYSHEDPPSAVKLVGHIRLTALDHVTVGNVKRELERRTGLSAARQCLVCDAIALQDCLPVHLLLSPAHDNSDGNDGVGGGATVDDDDALEGDDVCLKLICVPLSGNPSVRTAAPTVDGTSFSACHRALMPAMGNEFSDSDGGVPALQSGKLMSPVLSGTQVPGSAAEVAPPAPHRRPGAVPFIFSHKRTSIAPQAPSHAEHIVSTHITRMRRLYSNDAEASDRLSRGGQWTPPNRILADGGPEHVDPVVPATRVVRNYSSPARGSLLSLLQADATVGAQRDRYRFVPPLVAASYRCSQPSPPRKLLPGGGGGTMTHSGNTQDLAPEQSLRRTGLSKELLAALPDPPPHPLAALLHPQGQ